MHAKEDGYEGMATPNYNVQIVSDIIIIRTVAVSHLLKQGFHSLLYVGLGRCSELLGIATPLYSAARSP